MVKQILTFSRQESPEKKPMPIGGIVKEAVKLMRATLPTTITINEDIDDAVVMANATQIE